MNADRLRKKQQKEEKKNILYYLKRATSRDTSFIIYYKENVNFLKKMGYEVEVAKNDPEYYFVRW